MKKITGYLLDRATGIGISGKAVAFTKLDGTAITSADTGGYLDKSSVTDTVLPGRFHAYMELSPGPVNVTVTAGAGEIKSRKWDEQAKLGYGWSSDLPHLARAREGVILGYLNALQVQTPSGHTIRVRTGAALFNGSVFSIENGNYDIAGTPNSGGAINPRLDLVTLRQYNESAAGQLSGKQEVIVTLGTSSNAVPAVPTSADFVDFPLGVVSTVLNAASKTVFRDDRVYTTTVGTHGHPLVFTDVATSENIPGASNEAVVLNCPSGYRVMSGGYAVPPDFRVRDSFPNSISSWRFVVYNDGPTIDAADLYILCLDDITAGN